PLTLRQAVAVDDDRPRPAGEVEGGLAVAEGSPGELLVRWLADVADEVDEAGGPGRLGIGPCRPTEARGPEVGQVKKPQTLTEEGREGQPLRCFGQHPLPHDGDLLGGESPRSDLNRD